MRFPSNNRLLNFSGKMQLEVDVQFLLVMFADQSPLYGNVTISIDELKVKQHFANVQLPQTGSELTPKTFSLNFEKVSFRRFSISMCNDD